MRPRNLVLLAAGAAVLGLSAVAWSAAPHGAPAFRGTAYLPPEPAAEFRLTDHRGRDVRLSDYRGEAVLLFFGFVHCPDVCPLTLTKLGRVLGAMGREGERVRVLLVTTDPARDTPEVLADYVARFGAPIDGLTGDSATLAAVRAAYGAYAGAHPMDRGVEMTHTGSVFGIDPRGELRVILPMHEPDEVVAGDIRALLH